MTYHFVYLLCLTCTLYTLKSLTLPTIYSLLQSSRNLLSCPTCINSKNWSCSVSRSDGVRVSELDWYTRGRGIASRSKQLPGNIQRVTVRNVTLRLSQSELEKLGRGMTILIITHGCISKGYMLLVPKIPVRSGCCSSFRLCLYVQITNTKTADFFDSVYIITLTCINITALNIKLHILDFLC